MTNIELKETIQTKIKSWIDENEYVKNAFSHSQGKSEALALVGDAIINLIVYKELYPKNPEKGFMDDARKKIASRKRQYDQFKKLDFKDLLIKPNQINKKVGHTVVEALFGALYFWKGLEESTDFLKQIDEFMNYNIF